MKNRSLLVAGLLLIPSSMAYGAGSSFYDTDSGYFWYNKSTNLPSITKLVVFPVEGKYGYELTNDDLVHRLERELKSVTITSLARNKEENLILQNNVNFDYLTKNSFRTEQERAAAVRERINTNYYLVCRVKDNTMTSDYSPEYTEMMTLENYTEEVAYGRPYKRYNEYHITQYFTVPAGYVDRRRLNLEFTVYDLNGNKALIYEDSNQLYDVRENKQLQGFFYSFAEKFKNLGNESKNAVKPAKKGFSLSLAPLPFKPIKIKTGTKAKNTYTLGFGKIAFDDKLYIEDNMVRSCYFAMKNYAQGMQNSSINYDSNDVKQSDYYVRGRIYDLAEKQTWVDPYIVKNKEIEWSKEGYWLDDKGQKRSMTINRVRETPEYHKGQYYFGYSVSGSFELVDSKTEEVVYRFSSTKSSAANYSRAYNMLVREFYEKANKTLNEKIAPVKKGIGVGPFGLIKVKTKDKNSVMEK